MTAEQENLKIIAMAREEALTRILSHHGIVFKGQLAWETLEILRIQNAPEICIQTMEEVVHEIPWEILNVENSF